MELMDLGLEYLERAAHLRNQAKILASKRHSSEAEERDLRRRMISLYSDATECKRIGRLLISYYRREWQK